MSARRQGKQGREVSERVAIVFGDQLDPRAEALRHLDPQRDTVLMMEVIEESRHVASHKQRTALFFSAMRHFAEHLRGRGFTVRYVRLDDADNRGSFADEIDRAVEDLQPEAMIALEPGEWRVRTLIEGRAAEHGLPLELIDDPHFLTTHDEFAAWAEGRKELVLEHFYRWQRKRLGILVDAGKPEGGRWNFDADNRGTFDDVPRPPEPTASRPDDTTREVIELIEAKMAELPGSLEGFAWPVTRRSALAALDRFIDERLPYFGRYQDAMWTGQPFLYHALISPALNLKLLDPRECVERAVAAYEDGAAPLAAVEGFVRQIIGWREFIRGVYWREGEEYAARNELDETGNLPECYWSGDTEMVCVRESVGQVLEHGYGHHIQRLMVTGNLALIAGVHPKAVSDWYLGMFVDGVDWVTLPNALGMVMHADGGVVGTKPYAASGKYVKRMSNYCGSCRYDPAKRVGETACPFTTFYWDFLIRHRERFADNRRMAMILKNVDRMDDAEKRSICEHADAKRRELGVIE
jgi:deoxyribodipyrimidine photolyase-related protein